LGETQNEKRVQQAGGSKLGKLGKKLNSFQLFALFGSMLHDTLNL